MYGGAYVDGYPLTVIRGKRSTLEIRALDIYSHNHTLIIMYFVYEQTSTTISHHHGIACSLPEKGNIN